MAKIQDKLYNRIIEGKLLELSDKEKEELGLGNVFSIAVSDIRNISDSILSKLKAGDVVLKITGKQKHTYIVSYKGEGAGEGICLTYVACGYMETVSYDRSGSSWVYNSTDVLVNPTKLYLHEGEIGGDTYAIVCPIAELFNSVNVKPYFIGFSLTNSTLCYLIYSEGTFNLNDFSGEAISSADSIDDTVTPL